MKYTLEKSEEVRNQKKKKKKKTKKKGKKTWRGGENTISQGGQNRVLYLVLVYLGLCVKRD